MKSRTPGWQHGTIQPNWKAVKLTWRQHVLAASTRVSVAMICNRVFTVLVGLGHGCRQLAHRRSVQGRPTAGWRRPAPDKARGRGDCRHRSLTMKPCSRVWPIVKNQCLLTVFEVTGSDYVAFSTHASVSTRPLPTCGEGDFPSEANFPISEADFHRRTSISEANFHRRPTSRFGLGG